MSMYQRDMIGMNEVLRYPFAGASENLDIIVSRMFGMKCLASYIKEVFWVVGLDGKCAVAWFSALEIGSTPYSRKGTRACS